MDFYVFELDFQCLIYAARNLIRDLLNNGFLEISRFVMILIYFDVFKHGFLGMRLNVL